MSFMELLNQPLPAVVSPGFLVMVAAIFGACIGSFLNVCIWRIPLGESIVVVSSHCPKCNHKIPGYDNLPILSYLILRGRCRWCKQPITPRYLLVEAGTALLFTALTVNAFYAQAPLAELLRDTGALIVAIPCAFIDVEHGKLPDKLTGFGMVFGLVCLWSFPALVGAATPPDGLSAALIGLAVGWGGLGIFAWLTGKLFKQRTLGGGDLKYAGFMGATFGVVGLATALWLAATAACLVYLCRRLASRRRAPAVTVRFGPALALGVYGWLAAAPWLRAWGF